MTITTPKFRQASRQNLFVAVCLLLFLHLFLLHVYLSAPSFTNRRLSSPSYVPLSATLPHVKRPQKPIENDWTALSILTALATVSYERGTPSDVAKLLIFTTGIETGTLNRSFEVIACVVNGRFFEVASRMGCTLACHVPISALLPPPNNQTSKRSPPTVSLLLRDDDMLQSALKNEVLIGVETFAPLHPYVTRLNLPKNNSIPPSYMVKSSLTFHPSMLQTSWSSSTLLSKNLTVSTPKPPYRLCLMTAMRQFPHLIKGFFDYHRRLGVDKFFLYDNMCAYDLKIHEGPDVEAVYWPWARSQRQSFTHFLNAARGRCEWVAFFDADEYAFVGTDDHKTSHQGLLKRYIDMREMQGYGQVVFPFIKMRNHKHLRIPDGPVPEMYTMRDTDNEPTYGFGKIIVSTSCTWGEHRVHYVNGWKVHKYGPGHACQTYENKTYVLNPKQLKDNAHLVHYTDRSWEENRLKHVFGAATPNNKFRPKRDLGTSPPKWYMEGGEKYTAFRDYWRMVMGGH